MGKIILSIGLGIAFFGILIMIGSRLGIPFGKLPGDFSWKTDNLSFYMPLASSIIFSIILTVVLNLAFWFFRK
jgi:hypothetical protein